MKHVEAAARLRYLKYCIILKVFINNTGTEKQIILTYESIHRMMSLHSVKVLHYHIESLETMIPLPLTLPHSLRAKLLE